MIPDRVAEILLLIQESSASHTKYALILKKEIDNDTKNGNDLLSEVFKYLFNIFLTDYKDKNVYVHRILSFIAEFVTSYQSINQTTEGIHPTLEKIFDFILKLSNNEHDSHRYYACKLFNKVLQNFDELPEELYEELKNSMLKRLQDPKAAIRCEAVVAFHKLQDPTDPHDEITIQLCTLLDSDSNPKVRQLSVEKLAFTKHSLPFLLNRIRDVDANVRLTAFQKFKSVAKYLRVPQKRLILECGFNDISEKIRKLVETVLLQSWLDTYSNDYLLLMKAVRLDACHEDVVVTEHIVELMLNALFKSTSIDNIIDHINFNEAKLIQYENLNWESVLYYRIAVQYLRQNEAFEQKLDTVLPELVHFCQFIREYCDFVKTKEDFDDLEYYFTLQQFFTIVYGYDVSDTATRKCLNSLIHHVLQKEDLPADVTEVIVKNLEKTIPEIVDRSIFINEIISNISYGEEDVDYEELHKKETERQLAISQLQSDIISLEEQVNHFAVVEKDFAQAQSIKLEIADKKNLVESLRNTRESPEQMEKKTDVKTMLKCLNIAEALLRSPSLKKFNPAIATLNSELIHPALLHEDNAVKERALKCYALCCIIDQRSAIYGIHLFSGLIFTSEFNEILILSIEAAVDLLSIYGLSLMVKRDDDHEEEEDASNSRSEEVKKVFVGGTSLTDLLQGLADHLENEDPKVQEAATKGVCLLLLHSRITSSSLLSRIIIKWANPATDDDKLRQFIGFTLEFLTNLPNCETYFGDGVLTVIRTLTYAPRESPLTEIDVDNIIKFMVTLCQMTSKGTLIHTELAFKICNQMKNKPKVKVNFFFSKVLPLLNVPQGPTVNTLLTLCDELRDVIRDNQTVRNINKFVTNLTKGEVLKLNDVQEEVVEET